MKRYLTPIVALAMLITSCKNQENEPAGEQLMETEEIEMKTAYIGTYTKEEGHVNGQAEGIYLISQNPETGELEFGETVARVTNPSFVKASKDGKNLYAVSELGPNDDSHGYIHSFKVNEDKSLKELGKISTESFAPCYIAEDNSGQFVYVANYIGGVVMGYKKDAEGNLVKVQNLKLPNASKSHPHSVNISADNKFVYIPDLGNDKIWIFNLDTRTGKLVPNAQPSVSLEEGAGPRHFAFSKTGEFAYSINELNSTVSTFKVQKGGGLEAVGNNSSLPEDFEGENSAADIHLHPSGNFLYVSNRGHNSIAAFKIDPSTGELTNIGFASTEGKTPRGFALASNGNFLYAANQDSNNIVSYKVDETTGALVQTGEELNIFTPVNIEFLN